jgi:uncharacterized protein
MIDVPSLLAKELSLGAAQVEQAIRLYDEGGTVPFIARYRKERTGEMNETQLRTLFDRYAYIKEIEQRKLVVLKAIEEQGKLTDGLRATIEACHRKTDLEDLYLPFKPKRRTKASVARERGLEPLAQFIASVNVPDITQVDLEAEAAKYVASDKGVPTPADALAGAADILAEEIAFKPEHRTILRDYMLQEGIFVSAIREKHAPGTTKFEMYRDYKAPVKSIQPHNVLAIRRGERSGIVHVRIEVNDEYVQNYLASHEVFAGAEAVRQYYHTLLKDTYERLLREPLTNEVRSLKKEHADSESVRTFEANLRDVLLAAPAGMKPILGIDPGLRTGCKLAVIDATGKFIEYRAVFPEKSAEEKEKAAATLKELLETHAVQLIAIGNGTGSREADQFVTGVLSGLDRKPIKVIVNEAGASVYSVSKLAKEEFPAQDVTIRGAISIGRRLQDPLAELVKIDPRSIGVGQYQHDVDQKMLKRKLEQTVESCVNFVGVDVNTASREILRYVSGINVALATTIIAHRNDHGPFTNREQLRPLAGMGPKTFELAAGFLRIRGGDNPLDNSAVHPESYPIAEKIVSDLGVSFADLPKHHHLLKSLDPNKYIGETVGEPTVRDIISELQKPGRDPRKQFTYATFKEGVKDIKDLAPGLELEGVVTNVTNFGAFVDIGVHHDGLVHVSQLADRYVADPKTVVKVGQVIKVRVLEVNEQLKRISLTMKGMKPKREKPARPAKSAKPPKKKPPHPHDERTYTIEDLRSKFNAR